MVLPRKTELRVRGWLEQAFRTEPLEAQERVVDFAERLRADHPDYSQYTLYHILVGKIGRAHV